MKGWNGGRCGCVIRVYCRPKAAGETGNAGESVERVLRERARNRRHYRFGKVRPAQTQGRCGPGEALREHGLWSRPRERRLTREHLVDDAAERKNVAPGVDDVLPCSLFRTHVGRCPECEPGFGESVVSCLRQGPSNAEICDKGMPRRQQDILGLEVAMDDATAVSVMQCVSHLRGDSKYVLERQSPVSPQSVPKRLAVHIRHGVPEEARSTAGIVKRDDVRMGEAGKKLDLTPEPLGSQHVGEVGVKSLESNGPVVLEISGQEDRSHTAAPELALNGVGAREAGFQQSSKVCHCGPGSGRDLTTLRSIHDGTVKANSDSSRVPRMSGDCLHSLHRLPRSFNHGATAGAVRDRLCGHGGAHHDRPPAAVLCHRAGCQRNGRGTAGLRLLRSSAGCGPAVGEFLRPLRPPPRHTRRPAAHQLCLCHLWLRRIGAGTVPLPPGARVGRRDDWRGAGVRGRCIIAGRADQEPGLALGRHQSGRRGRPCVRVGDDQRWRQGAHLESARRRWRSWLRVLPRAFWSSRTRLARLDPSLPPPAPARARQSDESSPTGTNRPRGSSGSTP